jgi:hypothetical protein
VTEASFTVDGRLKTFDNKNRKKSLFRHFEVVDYESSYSGRANVADLRLKMKVELDDPQGTFRMKIENRYGVFDFKFGGKGSEFTYTDTAGNHRTKKLDVVPQKEAQLLELETYDGQYFVRIDGKDLLTQDHQFLNTLEDAKKDPRNSTEVSFGSDDTCYEVTQLDLGRDIHYRTRGSSDANLREDEPVYIEPGNYLMLGDNTDSSHDSRAWQRYTVFLKDGRKVEFERKAIEDGIGVADDEPYRRFVDPSKGPLKFFVKEDRFGNAVPIYESEYADEKHDNFFMVGEEYIVGRALWIWWPLNRAGRLIR